MHYHMWMEKMKDATEVASLLMVNLLKLIFIKLDRFHVQNMSVVQL